MTQRDKSLQTEAVWSVFTPAASDCGSVRNYPEQNVTRWCRALFIPMHVCVCYNVIRVYRISVHAPARPHQQPRVPTTFHPLPARRPAAPSPPRTLLSPSVHFNNFLWSELSGAGACRGGSQLRHGIYLEHLKTSDRKSACVFSVGGCCTTASRLVRVLRAAAHWRQSKCLGGVCGRGRWEGTGQNMPHIGSVTSF